jgi:hypothetical protein
MGVEDEPIEIKKHEAHLIVHKKFLDQAYAGGFGDMLRRDLEELKGVMVYGSDWSRRGHTVKVPKDPSFLEARERFAARYRAIIEEGLSNEFLRDDDGEGYSLTSATEDMTFEYDETEEEWVARRATLPTTVAFPVHTRRNEEL